MVQNSPLTAPLAPHRWSRPGRFRSIVAVAFIVLVGAAFAAFMTFRHIDEVVRDSYAQWWVAGIVNTYMDLNGGNWPTGWDDLEEPYEIHVARAGRPWTFEDLRSRVDIDFTAKPEELAKTVLKDGKASFRVVYLRNGKQHHYEGTEANFLIWEHLQAIANESERREPLKRPVVVEKLARKAILDAGGQWELDDNGHVKVVNLASSGRPRFSDAVLSHVHGLTEVRELNLAYSNFTDAGLVSLRGLNHLQCIYLTGTKVTDTGLANLEGMDELTTLVLADKNFTDAAFDHLVRLQNLRVLNLNGARVTDSGIERLHQMKNLKEVMLGDTLVTGDGVRKLCTALPACEVYFPGKP